MQAALFAFWQWHWQTLLYVVLCFAVGILAGLQGVVATIPREFRMALRNANGIAYVLIRGSIPAAIYVGLHKSHLINPTIIPSWAEALILGAGGESLLRSRVLLVFKPAVAGQAPTEESKGFLDLVFWIQSFFLQRAGAQLARDRMKIVGQYFDREPLNFRQTIQEARVEAQALGDEQANALKVCDAQEAEYLQEEQKLGPGVRADDAMNRRWCKKLGYALYNALSIDNFRALAQKITAPK